MAKMLKDEIQVIKAVLMEVDDDTVALVAENYHTEADGSTGKTDRSKSLYRWIARAWKKDDYKKMVAWYMDDSRRLDRGKWPDEKLPYFLCVGNGSENWRIGNFFQTKLSKLRPWDYGQKVLQGWQTKTDKRDEGYNPGSKYVTEGYIAPDGTSHDITCKETFLKNIGVNLIAPHLMKSKLPPPAKKANSIA